MVFVNLEKAFDVVRKRFCGGLCGNLALVEEWLIGFIQTMYSGMLIKNKYREKFYGNVRVHQEYGSFVKRKSERVHIREIIC